MNDTRLLIYLDDHLALMVGEVELIGRCWRSNQGTTLGEFLQTLESEVQTQESVARDVIGRLGSKEGVDSKLKQCAAWFAEKLGRFKLNDSLLSYSALSRVVELEALAAAAQERIAIWDNLDALAAKDSRLSGITFSQFRDQAQQHLENLNSYGRTAATTAFLEGKD